MNDLENNSNKNNSLTESRVYKVAEDYLKHENEKVLKDAKKKQIKQDKNNAKVLVRKEKSDKQKRIIEETDLTKLTSQQKIIWYINLIIYAGTPFFIYMFVPPIVMSICSAILAGSIKNMSSAYSYTDQNFYSFLGILCALIFLFRSARKSGSKVSEDITFSLEAVNWKYIGLMAAFGLSFSIFISAIYTLLPEFIMAGYDSATIDVYNTYDVVLLMVSLIILDPIAEEIVFRGYMLNRLLPALGEKKAIFIVTFLFAICHISPFWIVYGIALGYIFCKISIRHDNIIYSIAIHVGFNFPTLINYILSNNERLNAIFFGSKILIVCYGLVFGAIAYGLLVYYNKSENIGLKLKAFNR